MTWQDRVRRVGVENGVLGCGRVGCGGVMWGWVG